MARIQLPNLQCEHQLNSSELNQVMGGYLHATMIEYSRKSQAFNDPNNPLGAIAAALKQSNLPLEQKQAANRFLWNNPDAVIQIVSPV